MSSLQKPSQGGPQRGMVSYGSGLVFGGHVYPVLVDGVPMQPPVAVQQRLQMQQRQMQQQQMQQQQQIQQRQIQFQPQCHKPIVPHPQRSCPRSGAPAGTYMVKLGQQGLPCCPGPVSTQQLQQQQQQQQQQPQYHNLAMMQQLHGQLLQHRQMQAAMGNPFSHYGQYNVQLQPNAGGDSGGWNGYAMMQPSDVYKPYSLN
ncbi:nuclear transcription factor Y subunit beta [Drosophila rhopaloa]|uniref:Nuclear transcription factor Y subunit beta n=1 Tax=Drosophila rhopaloa TaxID=1041015 RepID=A0A6P4ERK3_DRORH|nr:nuclear transcription factor Y subunit beta [Drosophila rhopaloa]